MTLKDLRLMCLGKIHFNAVPLTLTGFKTLSALGKLQQIYNNGIRKLANGRFDCSNGSYRLILSFFNLQFTNGLAYRLDLLKNSFSYSFGRTRITHCIKVQYWRPNFHKFFTLSNHMFNSDFPDLFF